MGEREEGTDNEVEGRKPRPEGKRSDDREYVTKSTARNGNS